MKKALLIGLNRYMIPGSDLKGCVNDVKKCSSIIKMGLFDQGEELGVFSCCFPNTIFMTNRTIQFNPDINFYSNINGNALSKSIETYVKQKDVIGLLI